MSLKLLEGRKINNHSFFFFVPLICKRFAVEYFRAFLESEIVDFFLFFLSLDGGCPEKGSSESEDETPKRHKDSNQQRSGWRNKDTENEDCSSEASAEQGKYCTPSD